MKKKVFLFCFLFWILLGGCRASESSLNSEVVEEPQENLHPKDMKAEDLPQVDAFQDEFTRSFLQSTEETHPGYYPFLSNTGAFEMDLSKDTWIQERSYGLKSDSFEFLVVDIQGEGEESNVSHSVAITYTGHLTEEIHKENRLRQLKSSSGEDLEFKRIEQENQTIYIGPYTLDKDTGDNSEYYGYGALIFNNQGPGGIEVKYGAYCLRKCEEEREKDQAAIYDWILNGIYFKN